MTGICALLPFQAVLGTFVSPFRLQDRQLKIRSVVLHFETEAQLLRWPLATESSRASRRRAGRLWAAGRQTGSGQERLHAACPWFRWSFPASASGGDLKVGPFDLHRDGPTARIRSLAPGPDLVGHRDHARFDPSRIGEVLREGRLRSRGLSLAVRLDRPIVLTSRKFVIPVPDLPKWFRRKSRV